MIHEIMIIIDRSLLRLSLLYNILKYTSIFRANIPITKKNGIQIKFSIKPD